MYDHYFVNTLLLAIYSVCDLTFSQNTLGETITRVSTLPRLSNSLSPVTSKSALPLSAEALMIRSDLSLIVTSGDQEGLI